MAIQDFILLFEREFDDIPKGKITPDKKLKTVIEINSMNIVMLLAIFKSEYDIELSVSDLYEDITFSEFYNQKIAPNI